VAGRREAGAERLDERRLADAGHAADPDPDGVALLEVGEQLAGLVAVPGAGRLHQGDGLRDGGAPARPDPVEESAHVRHGGESRASCWHA